MVSFSSLEFMFRFLPVFLIIYYLVPSKYRETVFLAGSLVFYAVGEPVLILVLLFATALNYYYGRKVWELKAEALRHGWVEKKRKSYTGQILLLDVAILVFFKCFAAFVDSALLPLGISFYTFKMISFQIDILRGEISEEPKVKNVALYFTMFPQVVSGPIMRYDEGTFGREKSCSPEKLEDGLKYFVLGLGMKVLLADRLAILWNDLQMIGFQSISTPLAWLGAAGYSLRLYFDFWGYSLMASGILVMLGYEFVENFDHPYAAKSISEFYRRWHITLGSWFRDYIYIPLGGSRCSSKRLALNLALVWVLTGIWHGSGFNFVIWGVSLGGLIIMEKLVYGKYLHKFPWAGNLYVLILIPLTWVVFAITDLKQLGIYFGRLFPLIGGEGIMVNRQDFANYTRNYSVYFIMGILLCFPCVFRFYEKHKKNPLMILFLTGVFWLSVYYVSSSAINPFMYLNF